MAEARKLTVCTLLTFVLVLCRQVPSEKEAQENSFDFRFVYSSGVTDVSCFSAQLIEIQEGNVPTPVFSGFFKTILGSEKEVKIESSRVRDPFSGQMVDGGEGKIEVFQDELIVSLKTPFCPQRFSYFEIRGFALRPDQSCGDVHRDFLETGRYDSIQAIGRSQMIDPRKERRAVGVLTLLGSSDLLRHRLVMKRSLPMFIELPKDEQTKMRRFLICGGIDEERNMVLRTCDVVDELSLSSEPGPIMNFPRIFGAIVRAPDGRVSVAGGLDRNLQIVPFMETYETELGIFTKIRRIIPRFSPFVFSTENSVGIVGGINEDGLWEKNMEIIPYSSSGEQRAAKILYFLENVGKFGACFAESMENAYVAGGINTSPELLILKKERIDVGTMEAKVKKISSAKLLTFSRPVTDLPDHGPIPSPQKIKSLNEKEIKFGNCKMVYFEDLIIIATSYGIIYHIRLDKDEISDAYPEDQGVDIVGIEIPPSHKEFPFSTRKSKKGFSFVKLNEEKAVIFGGYDYFFFPERNTSVVVPSYEVLLISRTSPKNISRYKIMFPRKGGFSFLFEEEFLFILGGNERGLAEIIFVGNIEYPERIKKIGFEKMEGEGGAGE